MFFDYFTEEKILRTNLWKRIDNRNNLVAQSIARNIERLFNNTIDISLDEYLNTKLNVKHFGLPDIVNLRLMDLLSENKLQQCLYHALNHFEPRLRDVKIENEVMNGENVIVIKGRVANEEEFSVYPFLYKKLNK